MKTTAHRLFKPVIGNLSIYFPELYDEFDTWEHRNGSIPWRFKPYSKQTTEERLENFQQHIRFLADRLVYVSIYYGTIYNISNRHAPCPQRKAIYTWHITESVVLNGKEVDYNESTNMYTHDLEEAYNLAILNGFNILDARRKGINPNRVSLWGLDFGDAKTEQDLIDDLDQGFINNTDDISD